MRARTVGAAVALLVVTGVVAGVGPVFASATQTPHDASNDARQEAVSDLGAVQTTTTAATTSDGPPERARLVARYPAANGTMVERTVLAPADVARVAPPVNASRNPGWRVALTLTDDGAERFASTLVDTGFTEQTGTCPPTESRNDEGYCLLLVVDDDVTAVFGLGPALARSIESGSFQDAPQLVLAAETESEAVAVWRGFLDDNSEPITGTSTMTTTTSSDATATTTVEEAGPTSVNGGDSDVTTTATSEVGSTVSDSTDGFGVVAASVAAAALAAVLARRRRD